jgi:vesicle-associated membrane protein 4
VQSIQKDIEHATAALEENIAFAAKRGEHLDSLQNKTIDLATSAQGFQRGANRLRKKMWWKDTKMRMILIVVIIVFLAIIIVLPAGKSHSTIPRTPTLLILFQ